MTLENCIEYRRWAESMFNEVDESIKQKWSPVKVDEWHYLKYWIEKFDRIINCFTCYPEHHVMYRDGLYELKKLSLSL